jgi:hypothetical protein
MVNGQSGIDNRESRIENRQSTMAASQISFTLQVNMVERFSLARRRLLLSSGCKLLNKALSKRLRFLYSALGFRLWA